MIDSTLDTNPRTDLGSWMTSLERINEAFLSLEPTLTPDELIDAAPGMLCAACDFDRALISRLRGSTWLPAAIHVARDQDDPVNVRVVSTITTLQVPLTSSLIETEILRRRAARLVHGEAAQRHQSHVLAGLTQSRAYVAAPIIIADRVAGFLHADTYSSRRILTAADRVALQAFADMFGLAYERAAMSERLRAQHAAIQEALTSAAASVSEVVSDVGSLARNGGQSRMAPGTGGAVGRIDGVDIGDLSRREWEILGLLATGATNSQIAARLVVSESTIKSHVKRILRKLPAANRTEAVYRYTQLTRERDRSS
jgi:DNA-binding CsgD family transcriptional regulator